jgi:hypothetical protein
MPTTLGPKQLLEEANVSTLAEESIFAFLDATSDDLLGICHDDGSGSDDQDYEDEDDIDDCADEEEENIEEGGLYGLFLDGFDGDCDGNSDHGFFDTATRYAMRREERETLRRKAIMLWQVRGGEASSNICLSLKIGQAGSKDEGEALLRFLNDCEAGKAGSVEKGGAEADGASYVEKVAPLTRSEYRTANGTMGGAEAMMQEGDDEDALTALLTPESIFQMARVAGVLAVDCNTITPVLKSAVRSFLRRCLRTATYAQLQATESASTSDGEFGLLTYSSVLAALEAETGRAVGCLGPAWQQAESAEEGYCFDGYHPSGVSANISAEHAHTKETNAAERAGNKGGDGEDVGALGEGHCRKPCPTIADHEQRHFHQQLYHHRRGAATGEGAGGAGGEGAAAQANGDPSDPLPLGLGSVPAGDAGSDARLRLDWADTLVPLADRHKRVQIGAKLTKAQQQVALGRIRMYQKTSGGVVLDKLRFQELVLQLLPTVSRLNGHAAGGSAGGAAGDEEEKRAINAQKRRKPSSPTVGSTANIPALVSTATWVERRGVAALQIALEDLLISTFKDALLFSLNGCGNIVADYENGLHSKLVMGADVALVLGLRGFNGMDQFTGLRASKAVGAGGYLQVDEALTPVPTAAEVAKAAADRDDDNDAFFVKANESAWKQVLFSDLAEFPHGDFDQDSFKDSIPIAVAASLLRDPDRASPGNCRDHRFSSPGYAEELETALAKLSGKVHIADETVAEEAKALHALGAASGLPTTRFHLDQPAFTTVVLEVAQDFLTDCRFTPAALRAIALNVETHIRGMLSHAATFASAKAQYRVGVACEKPSDWKRSGIDLGTTLAPMDADGEAAAEESARKARAVTLLSAMQSVYGTVERASGSKIDATRAPTIWPKHIQLARRIANEGS